MNGPVIFFKDNTTAGLNIENIDVGSQSNAKSAMNILETALISISDELSRAAHMTIGLAILSQC